MRETRVKIYGKESLRGVDIQHWHLNEWPTIHTRGTTNELGRMHSLQKLGWLSSIYGLTLVTKIDGAQGKQDAW